MRFLSHLSDFGVLCLPHRRPARRGEVGCCRGTKRGRFALRPSTPCQI
ncbi:hypothetical protein HMPREF0262_02107 [Clostridium sp. ATCC 29733]|nr:hypothetical protein HMPREF0262_02107 [Clostridium sp. ATCC 29733]